MNTLRKFITYYSPYKTVFFIDLLCAAFISIVDLAYPQILRVLTNTLFTKDSSLILHALPFIAAGLLFMYLIQSLCKYYVSYQGHMMGACMERDMRRQLFDHYEKLSFSYYSKNNSGQMMSKLVSDLFDIAEFAHHGPENLFISVVKIIGSFIFLFLINARLALPLAIIVLCMFVFSIRQNKKMQETFMDNRRKIGDVNASLQDTLAGIRVVQSFTNEEIERKKFQKSNHAFLLSKKENYHCIGSFMGWNLLFQGLMYSVTLIYVGENSVFTLETTQISGVDCTERENYIELADNAKLFVTEKLMTDEEQSAVSNMDIELNGTNSSARIVSRSVGKGNSKQVFHPRAIGNNRCHAHVQCDSIIMDQAEISSIPEINAKHVDAQIVHEAAIGRINDEQLVKLRTFGMSEEEAEAVIIENFLN